MKTCPHTEKGDRLFLSGTMLRKLLSEGKVNEIPAEFSRPEVLEILKDYYSGLEEKVEVKVHGYATGDANKKK
jgi:sulfate adenylyltransferase